MMETLRHAIKMRYLLAVVMFAILAAVACSSDPTATAEPATSEQPASQSPTGGDSKVVAMLQLPNIADTVERVRPAVVSIVARTVSRDRFGRQSTGFGSGTGVIFDESGLVLTNNHVIEGGLKITVTQDDGTQVEAEIIGADRLSDLAVLRLPGDGYPSLPLRENGSLRAGDWVIAIGNALALPGGPTVTVGVVSALGRSIESTPGVTLYDLIQTDTSINPGNSGGPLIDLGGNLVGINTVVLRGSSGVSVEGIGFAVDVETAQQVALQLVELGHVRWAWMGVFLADLSPEVAAQVGLPIREGVIIQNTLVDGPSDRAGIHPGDIVVNIDGHDIATVSDLTRLLKQEFKAGQEVEVEVFRVVDGQSSTKMLVLKLGERPQQ
ncbi:MAG: trypsin-like peptidase domain-containing protein [Dehalococcoidia bacterium]|nr:trypsin-like peptidase domain-containing protein [Dehalococcoidia bacterium]